MSNKEIEEPSGRRCADCEIKEGRTRLAHKAEDGVGLHTGTVVAVTLHGAD